MSTKSEGLSKRIRQLNADGRTLIDDSQESEKTLKMALADIVIPYIVPRIEAMGGKLKHVWQMSLYDLQQRFHACGGPEPTPDNKKVCMKPDGGILFLCLDGKEYPIFVGEDKVQGTNDKKFEKNEARQATGNAIERAGKNIRGAEMLFAGLPIFPYVLFASGCDFHPSETIAKRIEMLNMGVPNHAIHLTPETRPEDISATLDSIVSAINIQKQFVDNKCIASVFVKSHRYDQMKSGASRWKKEEIGTICCKVLDLALEAIAAKAIAAKAIVPTTPAGEVEAST